MTMARLVAALTPIVAASLVPKSVASRAAEEYIDSNSSTPPEDYTEGDEDEDEDEDEEEDVIGIEPAFDELSVNVTVTRGQMATLPCFIDYLGKFKVAWLLHPDSIPLTYEDRRVVDDTRFTIVRPSVKEWNLQIRDTDADDAGKYLCTINTNPIRSKLVLLLVHEPAAIAAESWRREVTVVEGGDVTLTCNVTGNPLPTVRWYQKSEELIGTGEQLTLQNVSRHDSDIYECVADNGVGSVARGRTKLTVEFGPRIVTPNRRIGQSIGRETILECTITASPQAVSYWQKDGQRILNAYNPTAYSTAVSAAGGLSSAPVRSVAPAAAGALPPAPVGSAVQQAKYRIEAYDEGDYTLTLYLRVKITDRTDYGDYVCVASNARGRHQGVVTLYDHVGNDIKSPVAQRGGYHGIEMHLPSAVATAAGARTDAGRTASEPRKMPHEKYYGRYQQDAEVGRNEHLKSRCDDRATVKEWMLVGALIITLAACHTG